MPATLSPPPLERFSAEKFRQWLAGMVSTDRPSTSTDRDDMRAALVDFLAACPQVYGIEDRLIMWEKIGNAASAALETCNNDLDEWINETLIGIDAPAGKVATCPELGKAIEGLSKPDWWCAECLSVMRRLRLTLPVLAREKWSAYKTEKGTNYKGGDNGNE